MNILEKILESKRKEIFQAKSIVSAADLKTQAGFNRKCNSLKANLLAANSSGIIAEFKRKSPSKGAIKVNAVVEEIIETYAKAGAAGVSILTDEFFFGGSKHDLIKARATNEALPILRKDFILDPYQLYEAKVWGADVVLLIAAALKPEQIDELAAEAHELGMEVLLEVHDLLELQSSPISHVDLVGVNNRNLKNFNESNIKASCELARYITSEKVKVSESCINDPEKILELRELGYKGFLIGESFMKADDPGEALASYIAATSTLP